MPMHVLHLASIIRKPDPYKHATALATSEFNAVIQASFLVYSKTARLATMLPMLAYGHFFLLSKQQRLSEAAWIEIIGHVPWTVDHGPWTKQKTLAVGCGPWAMDRA